MVWTNGTVACTVTRVLPCAEQEWKIARTFGWPGSPAIKVFQVNFDPRKTRDPFHFDNVRHVSIVTFVVKQVKEIGIFGVGPS